MGPYRIHKSQPILSPLATGLYISFTDSSCTCKLIKHVTLVTVCSFSHLSCGSSFPLSACTVQNIPVCWHWWSMMNDILWEGKHIAPHIFKAPAMFIPVCADGHFLLSRMPIFDTENLTHIAFLNYHFYSCFEVLICGLFFRGIEPARLTIT